MLPRTAILDRLDWCQTEGGSMRRGWGNTWGNTSIIAFTSVLILALPASAQSPAPPATQASPQTLPPAEPTASYNPPNCDQYLPIGIAIPPNAQPTFFSYRLELDGNFHDLAIYRSSGSSDL